MKIRLLITGATGFVGQNLVPYLSDKGFINYSVPRADLNSLRLEKFDESDSIIHLAGKAHDLKKVSVPDEYYKINFELTRDLFDAFLNSKSKKFIFISSVKAVSDSVSGILDEDSLPDPQTDYGKSKRMAEDYMLSKKLPEGKSFYILRPCMIHGPGNKGNLNLLYQVVKKGIPYPLAAFKNKRSFLSVENLCFVISELISRSDIPSGVYHISDDEALSTEDVVGILSSSLNKKAKLWYIPQGFVRVMAKVGSLLHLPLTTERLNKLTENYIVSNQKIKKAIDKPLPLSTKDGLILTALSFQHQ